jgi:hypothetical protein
LQTSLDKSLTKQTASSARRRLQKAWDTRLAGNPI